MKCFDRFRCRKDVGNLKECGQTQCNIFFSTSQELRNSSTAIFERWRDDGADFVRRGLPKLVVIGIGAWIAIRLLALITARITRLAERHDNGSGRISQVRTLASVVRATGIGIIAFLASLEILPLLGVDLKPLLASAGVAGVALGLAAQTIVKDI